MACGPTCPAHSLNVGSPAAPGRNLTMSFLSSAGRYVGMIAREPPFRLFARKLLKLFPTSIRTQAAWEMHSYPGYLFGVLAAADEALEEGVKEMSVIEFGVAGGNGLIALERFAAAVEKETGVRIAVFRFDSGAGLPAPCSA